MAPPVSDRTAGWGRVLPDLLAPSPGRWQFALRLAVICALTTLVVQLYQTPEPALTAYIVFFLNKPDRATSLVLNAVLLVLITVIISLVIALAMQVIDEPMWRVASIAVISFVLLFLTAASKLRPLGSSIALIIGYALDLLGTAPGGELATRALLYAWLFIAIPAAVSIAVNLLVAPPPRRLLERALATRLRLCSAMLRDPDAATRAEFAECLQEGPGEIPAWLKLSAVEKTSPAQDIAALRRATESTTAILLLVDLIADAPEPMLPRAPRDNVAGVLDEMAAILEAGGYPVAVILDAVDDEAALPPLPVRVLSELREVLIHFAEAGPPVPTAAAAAKAHGGFLVADAFTNPEHVRYALKTTAAAMFCYGLYSILDWPGIHTCFITCYIVALPTTAETVEKLTLRIAGCVLGAAVGIAAIVFLIPSVTSIGGLMAVVFAGALAAAWIAAGSPRIAYAGFQIAFAFFLCVMQGSAPAFDMTTARDRVIGILLGILVSYLIFVHVWPVSVARRVDPAIGTLLRRLGAMTSAAGTAARRAIAAEALASEGAIERDLDLVAYEPRWDRPSRGWVEHRLRTLREIAALTPPLLLTAETSPAFSTGVAAALGRLADKFGPAGGSSTDGQQAASEALENPAATPAQAALQELIDDRLRNLENATAEVANAERAVGYAPA